MHKQTAASDMTDNIQMRALLVDDDPSWQQLLGEILSDAGLLVDVVDNVTAAESRLRQTPHRLAVIDLSLDGNNHRNQDGLQVLDAAQRHDPGCITILLTGNATVEVVVDALTEHGALTCLRKETFRRAHFRELVQQALASPSPWVSAEAGYAINETDNQPVIETHPANTFQTGGLAMVVEDDAGWRSLLSELLGEASYEVRLCNGFGEAIGLLGRERFHLAIIDLSLAGHNSPTDYRPAQNSKGYRLLASTQAAGIPTILVSGIATPSEIENAYTDFGIFASLDKQTFDRRAFLRTIDALQTAGAQSRDLENLTERERQVLELLARGLTNKEIASALIISTNTVKRHMKAIFAKLEVSTRTAAAARASTAGLNSGWTPNRNPDSTN